MPMSLSALPFESAHVPSTMTDRDYAAKGGERRSYDKRVYDVLAASISILGSTARRRKTANSSPFGRRRTLRLRSRLERGGLFRLVENARRL